MLFGKAGIITRFLLKIYDNSVYGFWGIAVVQTLTFFPVCYMMLKGLLKNIDPSLEEAARDMGASRWKVFTSVTLPLLLPGLGNAFLVTFIESIADFACGTGGFLTSALKVLDAQVQSVEDRTVYSNSIYGIEKKALPFLLCATNMLLHDIDNPRIIHGNSLEKNVREYKDSDRFDVILMNPPYGGNEKEGVKQNFPADLRSSETADLFMSVIMYRLKQNGRCAIILPDGFLFGTDNAKMAIKEKLLSEFNLHTVIRMPHSVFAPYTSITTNILFFDRTHPTTETWFYRLDMPEAGALWPSC